MLKLDGSTSGAPKIFAPDYYQRLFDLEETHWWAQGMREIAGRLIDGSLASRQDVRVLDAGCGTGRTLRWLEHFAPSHRIVGIDLSAHALEFCRRRDLSRLTQASVTALPFAAGSFDLIICFDVIQHLPRPGGDESALREFVRVLRPGGLCVIRTNVRRSAVAPDRQPASAGPRDFHQYTPLEVDALARAAGLHPLRATLTNMMPALAETWFRRRRPGDGFGRPPDTYEGLKMRTPPTIINSIMKLYMRCEASFLTNPNHVLPYGHSFIYLATRGPSQTTRPTDPAVSAAVKEEAAR